MKKETRLDTITKLISSSKIKSQEDLLLMLKNEGFDLTQATLSRDLKYLKITKSLDEDGQYHYELPGEIENVKIKSTGLLSIEFSKNIGVVKTLPGFANVRAIEIDNLHLNEILGTVAGDDTIMIVLRENISKKQIIKALLEAAPNLESKIII